MQLPPFPITVLDTETTGFIPKVHRIIEFASLQITNGMIQNEFECLCKIPTEIPKEVTILTRIFDADLENKPTFSDQQDEITHQITPGSIIVGQNIQFDIRMLHGEGIDVTQYLTLDTSMLASLVFPELASYSLPYMSEVLQLNHSPVHRALGDVRATTELLSKCWERMLSMSADMYADLEQVINKAPPAYKILFEAVPTPSETNTPMWLVPNVASEKKMEVYSYSLPEHTSEGVQIIEEPLSNNAILACIQSAIANEKSTYIIAVKNSHQLKKIAPTDIQVQLIEPSSHLLNPTACEAFLQKDIYTEDETLLALKLLWYKPSTIDEIPVHGGEKDIWHSTLACREDSAAYIEHTQPKTNVVLCNHWQLLRALHSVTENFLLSMNHPQIIIDDASSLEDTATKAFGNICDCHLLRTASTGLSTIEEFVDVLQIWLERIRNQQTSLYLTPHILDAMDAIEIRRNLTTILEDTTLSASSRYLLEQLQAILDPMQMHERIVWLEVSPDDRQMLHSVPKDVASILQAKVYDRFQVSLLLPDSIQEEYREILPLTTNVTTEALVLPHTITLDADSGIKATQLFTDPPAGKTIVLVAGRKRIDDIFIEYTVPLEKKGIHLLCQGFSGGTSRMQAEFAALKGDVIMVITGFQFEMIDLPANTVHQLFIETIPFDHPNHMVISKRSEKYSNSFMEYTMPRTKQRLYRIMRTFCKCATADGVVSLIDDRLKTKKYGESIIAYLQDLFVHKSSNTARSTQSEPPLTLF